MLKDIFKFLVVLFLIMVRANMYSHGEDKDSLLSKLSGNYRQDTNRINLINRLSHDFLIRSSEQSLRYAYSALELATQLDYQKGMAEAERYIGDDFASQSNFAEALTHLMKALDLSDFDDPWALKLKPAILNDLGEFNLNFHQYAKAIDYYNKAADLYSENKSGYEYTLILSNLAGAYQKIGDYKRAEETALKALAQSKLNNFSLLEGDNYRTLGGLYMNHLQYDSAKMAFDKAFVFYNEGHDEESKLITLQSIGTVYIEREDPLHAENYFQQVLSQAQKLGFSNMVTSSYQKLSVVDSMMGNFPRALMNFKKYVALKDSAESIQKAIAISKITSHSDLQVKQKHIEQLTEERNKQEISIKFKNSIMLFFSLLIPIILVLGAILLYNYNQKRKVNLVLSKQKEELQTLNTVKDRLFSIISHDLRSPLSNLEAILKLMESGELSTSEVVMLSGQLTHNVQETSYMLDNLLQWSKSQMKGITPRSQRINLTDLAHQAVGFFNAQADKKAIDIRVDYSQVLTTTADLEMIKLVMRNLLANAIKFTPSGGKIVIKIRNEKGQILVSIADSGIGMTPSTIQKLFSLEAITTPGTQNEKGTGLGLILCKDFVERNKGKIWAESSEGKGSTFSFSLPLIEDKLPKEVIKQREKFIE